MPFFLSDLIGLFYLNLLAMRFSVFIIALGLIGCTSESQQYQEPSGQEAVVADSLSMVLKDYYYARDFEGGVIDGREFLNDIYSSRLHAWYLVNLSRYREVLKATEEASTLVEKLPESPWGWFALAASANQINSRIHGEGAEQALEASRKALQLAPEDIDIQYFRSEVLRKQQSPEATIRFIDSLAHGGAIPAKLLLSRAQALYQMANDYTPSKDQALIDSSLATYALVRETDSTLVDAYTIPGQLFGRKNRDAEALALLEKAAQLSPLSSSARLEFGYAILGQPDIAENEKNELIRETVETVLALRPQSPELLYIAADLYHDIGDVDNRLRVENQLLEIEPEGPRSEWILLNRIRRFRDENGEALNERKDSVIIAQYRNMMQDYSDRDWVVRKDLLGEVFRNRFHVVDSTTSDEELLDIVQGMAKYEKLNPHFTYHRGPIELAERGVYFREAEEIAERGFEAFEKRVREQEKFFPSEADFQKVLTSSGWRVYDALGWIYFKEERLSEAEEQLAKANYLTEGKNIDVLMHLGQLYEQRYEDAMAQQQGDVAFVTESLDSEALFLTAFNYYKQAATIQVPYDNPAEEALKNLYTKRSGSEQGYSDFIAALEADDTAERMKEVLGSKLSQFTGIEPFSLNELGGEVYTNEILQGKVVVINVWSTTCGPCLWEMPELQKLYDKYQNDPEVLILTIAKDYNPGDVEQWIEENGYSLPVLIDNGFLDEMDVRAYPFTWFLDKAGYILYTKLGWSKYLLEEFSWRIEDLR